MSLTITALSHYCIIKHLIDRKTLLLVINSFVFSKLQYCSTVWSNSSNSNIDKLQKVQNFAGRIILGPRKYDHIVHIRIGCDH